MIDFVVSFLIGFIFPNIDPKSDSKQGKSGKKLKKKNVDTPLEQTSDVKGKLDPNVIECGSHKEICHVEYNLLPSKVFPEFQIDIVCWGAVTKIFTKEDVCCIKSYRCGNFTWVAFSVLHKLCSVHDAILTELLNFEVSFKFSQASNDLMPHVRNDVPKEFYHDQNEFTDDTSTGNRFKIVTQTSPQLSFAKIVTKEEEYNAAFPNQGNILSLLLGIPSDTHQNLIIGKINEFKSQHRSTKAETSSLNLAKEIKSPKIKPFKKKGSEKGGKSSKNIATASKNKFTLNLTGNLFFKEEKTCSSEVNELQSSSISFAAVFITVRNLLTYKQKKTLNPFTLNIQQLCNLQQKLINRIKYVYCEYVLNNLIIKQHTPRINLIKDNTLDFNYCHIFFLNPVKEDSSNDDIYRAFLKVEAIQTGRLIVKVYGGMSSVEDDTIPSVFGQRLTDPDISSRHQEFFNRQHKPIHPKEDGIVLLGTAVVNLFPLSTGETHFDEAVTLTSLPIDTEDESLGTISSALFIDKINTISLHSEDKVQKQLLKGIIPEDVLLWKNTTLQIEVKLAEPIYQLSLSHLLKLPCIYSRVIVVFKNMKAAVRVVQKIRGLNSILLPSQTGLYPLVVSDAEKKRYYEIWRNLEEDDIFSMDFDPRKVSITSSLGLSFSGSENWRMSVTAGKRVLNVLTGFFVDNFQEGILVIEGPTYLTFPRVFAHIYNLPTAHGYVVYNSDILFSKKLYSDFSNLGGLYIITLGKPMNSLLSESCTFIQGNLPIPAQKALLQLDLLRNIRTMHSACSMQIFPTIQQLLSFDMEFGVPLRICP